MLDITWLQDANYAFTQGYPTSHPLGLMYWPEAKQWVAQLEYFDSVRNVTWTDWRLPEISPLNGVSFQFGTTSGGATDDGYNVSVAGTPYAGSTASELAYHYYNNLGNVARCPPFVGWEACSTSPAPPLNTGPFVNFFRYGYWFNTDAGLPFAPPDAWAFDMLEQYGAQGGFNGSGARVGGWAVMDGDVAGLVPEPGTPAMWAAGLLALLAIGARRYAHREAADRL